MTIATYTLPGEFGRRLYHKYGADRPMPPTPAWAVNNGEVLRVIVTGLRSATGSGLQADYAGCQDGKTVSTFYLFPVARHCKPALKTIQDDFGTCRQWVARLKSRCLRKW